ncbi:hypothetical protein KY362_04715, partial [Candidatus Woesearchaeota archaeon]|nr:hypothetical protein [Candidatus Woesearchaeota archaeon]
MKIVLIFNKTERILRKLRHNKKAQSTGLQALWDHITNADQRRKAKEWKAKMNAYEKEFEKKKAEITAKAEKKIAEIRAKADRERTNEAWEEAHKREMLVRDWEMKQLTKYAQLYSDPKADPHDPKRIKEAEEAQMQDWETKLRNGGPEAEKLRQRLNKTLIREVEEKHAFEREMAGENQQQQGQANLPPGAENVTDAGLKRVRKEA